MRRAHCWILLLSAMAPAGMAQEGTPAGILRGDLLSWTGTSRAGELIFRGAEDRVFQCGYDERTYFERSRERITPAAMHRGDRLEVVADKKEGGGVCYARTVEVIDAPAPHTPPGQRPRLRTASTITDAIVPRGNLTFTGIVLKNSAGELLLRTRGNERKTILLRPDTRYLGEGQILERDNLPVHTRVFIRAGRNIEEELEAYQIVWGDILEPVLPRQP